MKVKTSRFGEIEVPDSSLISFPDGVVGLRENKRFVIFDCGDDGVLKWLQSADDPEIAFVICEAKTIAATYNIALSDKELELLKAKSTLELLICLILTIPENPYDMTANMLGPLCFNPDQRIGIQLVLINPEFSTRHRVFLPGSDTKAPPPAPARKGGK